MKLPCRGGPIDGQVLDYQGIKLVVPFILKNGHICQAFYVPCSTGTTPECLYFDHWGCQDANGETWPCPDPESAPLTTPPRVA